MKKLNSKNHLTCAKHAGLTLLSAAILSACGGGGSYDNDAGTPTPTPTPTSAPVITTDEIPSRSSSIALTADNSRLVVVNRQSNSVSVIQVKDENGEDIEELLVELDVGNEPRFVAVSPDGYTAFVTNSVDGTVSVINLNTTTPEVMGNAIAVGMEPRGIAITPNGKYAYVANHTDGTVSVISTSSLSVVNTVAVEGNPMAIAISDDGDSDDTDETVYITQFYSEVIDPTNRPDGFNDSKQGKVNYFTVSNSLTSNSTVFEYTLAPLANAGFTADRRQFCQSTRDTLQLESEVVFFNSGADSSGDGAANLANETFCSELTSTDASVDGLIANTTQGAYTNYLYGAMIRNNTLYIPNVGAAPEPPVRFNLNVQALVSSVNLSTGDDSTINLNNQIKVETQPENETESLDRLFGNDVVAIDANAAGDDFLIVSRGGNYVMRASIGSDGNLDIGASEGVVRFQTGNIPSGVVMSNDGTRAYTNNEVNTSVTSIDLENNTVLTRDISSSEPPAPGTEKHRNIVGKLVFYTALGTPDTFDTNNDGNFDIELRDIEPLAFRGKASDNAWSGCASCHEDGHSDNVTWIFPTGPRQTIPLEGTFANSDIDDQRILNWNGVRGSVTDFNNNSRGVQGGVGFATNVLDGDISLNKTAEVFNHGPTRGISDALDAMTDWVTTVKAPAMADITDTEALASGRDTFEENCASCHGGEKWTKSSIAAYENNPTFNANPLGANFFAVGREPAIDPNLSVGGPQIVSLAIDGSVITFLDTVGSLDLSNPLEIRGAGAIGGGEITIAGDVNEGVVTDAQSTQGIAPLGAAGFNTPSLLGVGLSSPYFHDGSAITLYDVFAKHTLPAADNATIESVISDADALKNLYDFVLSIDDDTPIINF